METIKAATELSTSVDLSWLFLVYKVRKHSTNSGDALADETGQIFLAEKMDTICTDQWM